MLHVFYQPTVSVDPQLFASHSLKTPDQKNCTESPLAHYYMSQYPLIPYGRVEEMFSDQASVPLSSGTVFNFNKNAYDRLEAFESLLKSKLTDSALIHADETGININGKRLWLHSASNDHWTLFSPHEKRGSAAINEIGVIPKFKGVLCHDHRKPYFNYGCQHAL